MLSVRPYALSGGRFPGSIQIQSVQRRVGKAIFYEAGQTPDLALGYFVVQLFTSGFVPRWLDLAGPVSEVAANSRIVVKQEVIQMGAERIDTGKTAWLK
jgi:hypothetical protein